MGCQQICNTADEENQQVVTTVNTANKELLPAKKSRVSNHEAIKASQSALKESINQISSPSSNPNIIKFTVNASNIHKMVPIWVEDQKSLIFKVNGKWGFKEAEELFDSMGCDSINTEEKPNNKPFGSLIGFIPGEELFVIFDELEYYPKRSGPLYLFQNNGLFSVTPIGSLDIEIVGGIPMSTYDIEKKIGWDLSLIDTSIPEMKEQEATLLVLINKARTNPKLFIDQFLNKEENPIDSELREEMESMQPVDPLSTSLDLYNLAKNHAIDLGESDLVGHMSTDGSSFEDRLKKVGIETKVFAENCIFGYNDPLEIVLRLLLDEDNEDRNQRKIILNREFNKVGLVIEPHKGEYVWSCIQDYIQE